MADWLSGVDPADLIRVEIVRVTLVERPSAVGAAILRLHLASGSDRLHHVNLEIR